MTEKKTNTSGRGQRELRVRVKTAKGRKLSSTLWLERQLNDPYVAAAKAQGWRSRAAFKLIEMDDRFHLIKPGMRVLDLGAAPGGWSQVARKRGAAQVVALDLLPIDPIAGVDFLQGDFNDPDTMVLSESQYFRRMRFESPMDFKLRSDILGRAVLFIGYSFRDPNINYLFHIVNELLSGLPNSYSGRRAYIALPEPSEFERRLFHLRNIEVIGLPSDDLASAVASLLREMRG